MSQGRSCVKAKKRRSQWARYSSHLWSARKSSTEDLISMIQISPRSLSATRSARRPDGKGNSLMHENASERKSRVVARATARAVSDCLRSGGGTRLIWRTGCSMSVEFIRFRNRVYESFASAFAKKSAFCGYDPANRNQKPCEGEGRRHHRTGDAVRAELHHPVGRGDQRGRGVRSRRRRSEDF